MSAVLILRTGGPAELFAVLRPLGGPPEHRPVLVLADGGMAAQVVAVAARPFLDRAERAALAGQLGLDDQEVPRHG